MLLRYATILDSKYVRVCEITAELVERATDLRAAHGLRTPDAIHLATALCGGASVFLTGDATLKRCSGIAVEVLTPSPG